MHVGIGYDIHPLVKGRKFILGGVVIPFAKGPLGHSDGDVLLHALVDAVLGAAGAGDIGDLFPDTDNKYRGAASALFVKKTCDILKKKKLKIVNLDATVLAEAPKLAGYKAKIKVNVARLFHLKPGQVNIKAKTHEGFGAVGKGAAIACLAAASLS